jgi:hypothetical protein
MDLHIPLVLHHRIEPPDEFNRSADRQNRAA